MATFNNTNLSSLHVGDLHPSVTERMLMEMFSYAGHVHSVHLCKDQITRSSLSFARVIFWNKADAEKAMEMFHYELLLDQPMRVVWYERDPSVRKSCTGNLFIKHLDKSITSTALYDTFSCFGRVLSCKVVGYETGSSGYGYVQFESREAAELAKEKLDGMLLNDRQVVIEFFVNQEERRTKPCPCPYQLTNIYIKHLSDDVDDTKLRANFSKFGPIASIRVITDGNGKSKGFGFVRFERHGDAQMAIEEMEGKELSGKRIHVSYALRKGRGQAELCQRVDHCPIAVPAEDNGLTMVNVPAIPAEDSGLTMVNVPAIPAEDSGLTIVNIPAVPAEDSGLTMVTVPAVPAEDNGLTMVNVPAVPAEDNGLTMVNVPAVSAEDNGLTMFTVLAVPAEDNGLTMVNVPAIPAEDNGMTIVTVPAVPAEDGGLATVIGPLVLLTEMTAEEENAEGIGCMAEIAAADCSAVSDNIKETVSSSSSKKKRKRKRRKTSRA